MVPSINIVSFQHLLEGLVEEVYLAMGKEYLHRRDSRGRHTTRDGPGSRVQGPGCGGWPTK